MTNDILQEHLNADTIHRAYQDTLTLRERSRMLRHLCDCPSCQALYDVCRRVWRALDERLNTRQCDGAAYLAVAGVSGPSAQESAGWLNVPIDLSAHCFLFDDLTCGGSGEKYALNPEDHDHTLEDDGGLLRMTLTETTLQFTFRDDAALFIRLRQDADDTVGCWQEMTQGTTVLPLPEAEACVLELLLP